MMIDLPPYRGVTDLKPELTHTSVSGNNALARNAAIIAIRLVDRLDGIGRGS
jgi:hypothetical protein